jgi:hypothetical protein
MSLGRWRLPLGRVIAHFATSSTAKVVLERGGATSAVYVKKTTSEHTVQAKHLPRTSYVRVRSK